MIRQIEQVDVSHIPELLELISKHQASDQPIVLKQGNNEVAVLMPPRLPRHRQRRPRPFTQDDAIWNLEGIGQSGIQDVSENVDRYLADGYLDLQSEAE
jgi:hypothetical protein